MSDMGITSRQAPPQSQVHNQSNVQGGRGAQSEQGVIAKGIGFLQKVWMHITGKAATVHDQQMTSLRDHVSVKFGPEGLLRLNATLQKQGWAGDSTKIFSSSELSSTLRTVGSSETRFQQIRDELQNQPLSEQLKNPTLKAASYELARAKFATGQVEFLDAMNDLEANRGTMSTDDFNARVAALVSKHIDERGQGFSGFGAPGDKAAEDHNINIAASKTGPVCELLDKYKALLSQGKTSEANAVAEQMYDLMNGEIKDDVNRVWRQDNHQKKDSNVFREGPLATYNQAFNTAALELLPTDPQYLANQSATSAADLRAAEAAQFSRV